MSEQDGVRYIKIAIALGLAVAVLFPSERPLTPRDIRIMYGTTLVFIIICSL